MKAFQLDDTIVAVSTPVGKGARAVIRITGPDAIDLGSGVFHPLVGSLGEMGGFRAADGLVHLPGAGIELPARVYLFRAPHSYTKQDTVELHVPASPAELTSELINAGARHAEPGEFTARAFLSGRIDLTAAEAVADVIDATNDAQLRAAMVTLGGHVERLCSETSSEIADILAMIEASIDLTEEDISLDAPGDLANRLEELSGRLHDTAVHATSIPEGPGGPAVVLTGRVNVGKSSLLNALSGTDRAIVSVLAGTTRDVLTASMILANGRGVSLVDAAGFAHPTAPPDKPAHKAAHRAVEAADVIAFVVDIADRKHLDDDLALLGDVRRANRRAPVLLLANKTDLLPPDPPAALEELRVRTDLQPIATSAVTKRGLAEFGRAVAELLDLTGAWTSEIPGLHERQKRHLLEAADSAHRAAEVLHTASEVPHFPELAAVELREGLSQLGQISGQIVTEDLLGRIFARFCVGK